jgi:hypothetical protein
MNSIEKTLAAVAVAMFGLALAPDAGARSTSGWYGKPRDPSTAGCFSEAFGSVTNSSCAGAPELVFPLIADAPGAWTVVVDVTPTTAPGSIACGAFCFAQDNANYWGGPGPSPSTSGQSQTLTLSVSNVPMWGALYLECTLAQGAKINTVNWYQ